MNQRLVGAGQQGKLTLLLEDEGDYGELAFYRRVAGYCIGFTRFTHALDELSRRLGLDITPLLPITFLCVAIKTSPLNAGVGV